MITAPRGCLQPARGLDDQPRLLKAPSQAQISPMRVLGIETSCDETGVAVFDTALPGSAGLRAHAVYSQIALHAEYGGVVPGTGQPRPCAQAAAAGQTDPGRGRPEARGHRRGGLYRRPRAGRGAAGRGRGGPLPGLGAGSPGGGRAPHGRPPAGPVDGRRPARAALRGPAGLRRAYPAGRGGRHRPLPAAGRNPGRRRRRSLRQDRQGHGPAVSGRAATGGAGGRRAGPAPTSSPGR